jgi:pimeloyl-ACP methyl ester carboxylesterase
MTAWVFDDGMGYVDVAGLQTWHEVTGEGEPLVLLHGGFASGSSFFEQTPVLAAAGYRVYVPERRAHGHTRDVDGPITYSLMADDTIAYLETAVAAPAHLIGWSDGAVVGLLVALRRPELVNRMVLIGQYYNSTGKTENPLTDELLKADSEVTGFLRDMYAAESPDGADHFPVVHAKMVQMFLTEPELDLENLRAVQTPTLVLQGDRDEVTVEHSQAVAEVLPNGRLAVLPGTHMLPLESPEVVNALLISYLRGDPPEPGF